MMLLMTSHELTPILSTGYGEVVVRWCTTMRVLENQADNDRAVRTTQSTNLYFDGNELCATP